MNKATLTHIELPNQPEPSWLDGMYDGTYANGHVMSNEQLLDDYTDELVLTRAHHQHNEYTLTLDMLTEDEQHELARLYIESIDREIEWACYGEDQTLNSDFLCALLSMLKDNNDETRQRFAEITQQNVLVYYKKTLNALLQDACNRVLHNQMHHLGYYPSRDTEHDEIIWRSYK